MSYEKHVYARSLPRDLPSRWRGELREHGLEVEFHPAFSRLSGWNEGYLPCRLQVDPKAFVGGDAYPAEAMYAGFEVYCLHESAQLASTLAEYREDLRAEGRSLSRRRWRQLESATAQVALVHGGFRWTVAEFRLCWFAAATLTELCGGLLFDEWAGWLSDGYMGPRKALRLARKRSAAYEAESDRASETWSIPRFEGWQ